MALRLPPMQALRAFEAAARAQSLTKAAQSLSLTHGAISHQIKSLESDLGVRLVERAGRGIRLTDEGERFARRVRAAFAELAAAVNEITARANPRQLRVSVVPSFAARWLLPRIGRFVAAYPDIDLDVRANMANVDFAARRRRRRDPLRLTAIGPTCTSNICSTTGSFRCAARARERTPAGAPRRPREVPAAALGRRALEALVRGGGARLAGADARADLQRFVAHDPGRRRGTGHRACAHSPARQRRAQRRARAAVRHRRAGAAEVLPRLSAADGEFAEARAVPRSGCTTRSRPTKALASARRDAQTQSAAPRSPALSAQRNPGRACQSGTIHPGSACAKPGRSPRRHATTSQYRAFPGVRGNGMTSRTLARPVT